MVLTLNMYVPESPWKQHADERANHLAAFQDYCELGHARSVARLAALYQTRHDEHHAAKEDLLEAKRQRLNVVRERSIDKGDTTHRSPSEGRKGRGGTEGDTRGENRPVSISLSDAEKATLLALPPTTSRKTLEKWCTKYEWRARVKQYDLWQAHQRARERLDLIVEMEGRHLQLAKSMQHLAGRALKTLLTASATQLKVSEVVALIREARKMERDALGVHNQEDMMKVLATIHERETAPPPEQPSRVTEDGAYRYSSLQEIAEMMEVMQVLGITVEALGAGEVSDADYEDMSDVY